MHIVCDESLLDCSGVYVIKNLTTGRIYVGSTARFWKRYQTHKFDLNKQNHRNRYLQFAWNKYGAEDFTFDILEVVNDQENLIQAEQAWIDRLSSVSHKKGYNICPTAGSCRGKKMPRHIVKALADKRRGILQPNKIYTIRGRKNISESRSLEFVVTDPNGNEYKVSGLRQFCKNNGLTYQKMNDIANGRASSHRGWSCRHIYTELVCTHIGIAADGTLHKIFDLIDFCRKHQLDGYHFRQVLRGKQKHHRGWRCQEVSTELLLKAEAGVKLEPFAPDEYNGKSREWIITNPNGESFKVRNLEKFCKANNITSQNLRLVAKGVYAQHKGWKCQYANLQPLTQA